MQTVSNGFVGQADPNAGQLGSAFNSLASIFQDTGQRQMRELALADAARKVTAQRGIATLLGSGSLADLQASIANGGKLQEGSTAMRIADGIKHGIYGQMGDVFANATDHNAGSAPAALRADQELASREAAARQGAPQNYVDTASGVITHGTAGAPPVGSQPLVGTDDFKAAQMMRLAGAPAASAAPDDTPAPVSSAFSASAPSIPASAPAAGPAPAPATLGSLFGAPAAAAPALSAAPAAAPLAKAAAQPDASAVNPDVRTILGLDKADKVTNYQVLGPNGRPSAVGRTIDGKTDMTTGQALPANATMAGVGTPGVTINTGDQNTNTYGKDLVGGLAAEHKTMMDGTEGAQTQLQGIHAMQGALAAIQAHGGVTGFGAEQLKDLKSAINVGAGVLGLGTQFDISDPEFLAKFNRQIAGAQAKAVGGARVTNFELQNYLAANPGLAMSPTGNTRLLGIQSQIAQRSVALGQALRGSVANAVSQGGQPDAGANEQLIRAYDAAHPITDPITGQDLTKNLVIPDLQSAPGAAGAQNGVRTYTPGVGFH